MTTEAQTREAIINELVPEEFDWNWVEYDQHGANGIHMFGEADLVVLWVKWPTKQELKRLITKAIYESRQ